MENSEPVSKYTIRPAQRGDCDDIARLIKELAEYEKMPDQAKLTGKDLERDAFDSNPPYFYCIVAVKNSPVSASQTEAAVLEIVAYALYVYHYSTLEGKMVYLEDMYITLACRQEGLGSNIIKYLGKMCVDGGFARLKFECLEWNEPSIKFYEKHKAVNLTKAEKRNSFRFGKKELALLAKIAEDEEVQQYW